MLLPGPFRTTHSYFNNSVSIGPTSVSHYQWMLSKHPSLHAKCQVNTFNHYRDSHHSVSLWWSWKDCLIAVQHAISPKGEVSRDGLESNWQGCCMEALQAVNEGDLHGRPGTRGEAVCPDTCGRRWQSLQLLGHSWRHCGRPQESRPGMGRIWAKLQTINFILAFQRCLLSRFQARPLRVNSRPGSPHQADCQGMPMEEGAWGGVNDRLAVPCHHLLWDP